MKKEEYKMNDKNYYVPTGQIIKKYLEANNISQKDMSERLDISEKHISKVLSGKSRLTEDFALKLEYLFKDIPASYWLNLEAGYREFLVRNNKPINFGKEKLETISSKFHFDEVFRGLKWDLEKKAQEMLKILQISSYDNFENVYSDLCVNFFEDGGEKESMVVWLKLCEEEIEIQNEIENIVEYDKERLEEKMSVFKQISGNTNVDESIESCRKLCNKLGIYLVIREAISNCKIRGALTTYKGHPAIYISKRFKSHDHVWFAIIHELFHLLKHYEKNQVSISYEDDENKNISTDKKEEEANKLTRDFFIDPERYEQFVQNKDFSTSAIKIFAAQEKTTPGIVIGRLQHDKEIVFDKMNYERK
jgi:addiction module HigA family antidote